MPSNTELIKKWNLDEIDETLVQYNSHKHRHVMKTMHNYPD